MNYSLVHVRDIHALSLYSVHLASCSLIAIVVDKAGVGNHSEDLVLLDKDLADDT